MSAYKVFLFCTTGPVTSLRSILLDGGGRTVARVWGQNAAIIHRAQTGCEPTPQCVHRLLDETASTEFCSLLRKHDTGFIISEIFKVFSLPPSGTAVDNQDEKCKSFHILFEEGMVQDPGRGKGLITNYSSHRKLVGLKTRINLLLYFLTCTNTII